MLGSNMNPVNAKAAQVEVTMGLSEVPDSGKEGRDIVAELVFPRPYRPLSCSTLP